VIALNGGAAGSPFPRLAHDVVGGVRLAADHLRHQGCGRLGCIHRAWDAQHDDDWRRRAACLAVGDVPLCESAPAGAAAWLRRHRPDGVVLTHPPLARLVPCGIACAAPHHLPADLAETLLDQLEEALRLGRTGLPELPRLTLVAPRLLVRRPGSADLHPARSTG
jgi:hypothetical protein